MSDADRGPWRLRSLELSNGDFRDYTPDGDGVVQSFYLEGDPGKEVLVVVHNDLHAEVFNWTTVNCYKLVR